VKVLENMLVVAGLMMLGWLTLTEGIGSVCVFVGMVLGALIMGIAVWREWPFGAVSTLIVSSAMPRLAGTVFSLHVRPEHVALAYIFIVVLFRRIRWNHSYVHRRVFDYALVAYVTINFLSSAVTSPQPMLTLRWAIMSAIVVGAYFLIRLLIRDERSLHYAFIVLLWTGAVESAFGLVCFLSNRTFGSTFGVSAEQYGYIPGTHGTQYEANIFGAYSACCAIMFLVVYLLDQESRRSWHACGLALTTAGTLVSLSRAAIVALLLASVFVVWTIFRRRQLKIRRLFAFGLVGGVILMATSSFLLPFLEERFSTIDVSELAADSTTQIRLVQIVAAYDDVRAHPLWGTGTDSFRLMFDWRDYMPNGVGADDDTSGWIGSTPIRILHDTGVVGLLTFLTFLGSLGLATRKALRNATGFNRVLGFALVASLLVYCVTFQSTDATLLAFPWVHLGMLAAALNIFDAKGIVNNAGQVLPGIP
jgi:hypothetical protein